MRNQKYNPCKPLSLEDKIWIAAFWDGEGHACVVDQHHRDGHFTRCARVGIAQDEREVLEWIRVTTGIGSIYPDKKYFRWMTSGLAAVSFLKEIQPWVRTQKHLESLDRVLVYYETRTHA
jgi:hypothetical protein